MSESFVTVEDAKRQLCLGTTSIYNLMKCGELRRVKLGRKTVLLASDLQNYIQRKAAEAAPVAA